MAHEDDCWFARLQLLFYFTGLDDSRTPLAFVEHFDNKGVSKLYELPLIQTSNHFSVVPCSWIVEVVPVKICWDIANSYYVDVDTEWEEE